MNWNTVKALGYWAGVLAGISVWLGFMYLAWVRIDWSAALIVGALWADQIGTELRFRCFERQQLQHLEVTERLVRILGTVQTEQHRTAHKLTEFLSMARPPGQGH